MAAACAVRLRREPPNFHLFVIRSPDHCDRHGLGWKHIYNRDYLRGFDRHHAGRFPNSAHRRSERLRVHSGAFLLPVPCNNSFVVKLDPTGTVVFATYLGGNGDTSATSIAVDQQGNVYVAGTTSEGLGSTNTFPVTPGAAFTNPARISGFVAKLNPAGSQLVYATFIPGATIAALALDSDGNAFVTGSGFPSSFPTTAGAFQVSPRASSNSFPGIVAKLNLSGSALLYATYLSGSGTPNGNDYPSSIAVDAEGNAFIAGSTRSTDFPVTSGAFLTSNPGTVSVFLTKLDPQGDGLVYSTYLGEGAGYSATVKLDAQGTAFVAGATASASFPTTGGGIPRGSDVVSGFLTRFSMDGSSLVYSIYVPGSNLPALRRWMWTAPATP